MAVLGADGYTGWPLVCHLLDRGDDVIGVDNLTRRSYAGPSVTPIASHEERADVAAKVFPGEYEFIEGDIGNRAVLANVLAKRPDTIVNLAQIPSAPVSMESAEHAWHVQENNVRGSLELLWALRKHDEDIPLVQLATMGEYGTPDEPLPEGFLEDGRPAPKEPGSFYHASKCQMTTNTLFASRTWDLPVTEIYQGIVYGLTTTATQRDPRLVTRFDADSTFGTALNRFTAQAVAGEPLTVYGKGGQCRAMLSLADCIQCLTLAIDNPPGPSAPGNDPYRAVNQFDGAYRINNLAAMVADATGAEIDHIDNPRVEDDSRHFYEPEREVLDALGYEPTRSLDEEFLETYNRIQNHADRIDASALRPQTEWRDTDRWAAADAD